MIPPESSKCIICEIPSPDKELNEFPSGHVGLSISTKAHKELWPKVTEWISVQLSFFQKS